MEIRRAKEQDMDGINKLLLQVCLVHHKGRPVLFKYGAKKYTDEQLKAIIHDEDRPIFTAVDESGNVLGYAFCIFQQHIKDNILTDIKTLYIDDLCVDEEIRGRHIGKQLYETVLSFAREQGCYNVTLNVWSCNESAMKFYQSCGLKPQKIGMETTNLCKLENGCQLPKEENIEKIAKILDVEIRDLFDFGHLKTTKDLKNELLEIIKNATEEETELYYKIIISIKETVKV